MSGVIERLKRDDTGYDDDHQHSARKGKGRMVDDSDTALSIVSQLYPADCPNLMAAMKSIISSIVDRDAEDTKSDCSLRCECPGAPAFRQSQCDNSRSPSSYKAQSNNIACEL